MQQNEPYQIPEVEESENPSSQNTAPDPSIMTTWPPHQMPPMPHLQVSEAQKKQYTPLTWEQCFDKLFYLDNGTSVFSAGEEGPLYFCIHGAGHSAQSFARLAKEIKKFGTCVAFDLKAHGESKVHQKNKENIQDFSIGTLVKQTLQIFKEVVNMEKYAQKNIVMVGHSLGGSICTRVTDILANEQKNERVHGMVIIDVVQGTAIEALPFMNQILNDRPQYFQSLESAIKWSITTGTLKKVQSARISIPAQLKQVEHNGLKYFTWRVNLKSTQKYWIEWFKNLSKIFLQIHIPKVLVTAQKQRLDKELTIAQMQGKFKLTILYHVGHSVQEDDYKGMAKMLNEFIHDFRIPMDSNQSKQKKQLGIAKFQTKIKPYQEHI